MRMFDISKRASEERTEDIISGQVMTIKNQSRRIDDLENYKKKADEVIANLKAEKNILKHENNGLKTALKFQMTGDK
ncbi:hypothetical protein PAF15_06620 [Weissella koreensis]|uniref:hypothetical protein n=1 Tax=Weissella koreensis TaxID=165096 RepID=UPI0022BA2CC6|nr:hypothetical protein [Weissella koreensis]MCZ9311612.1 hypothetical protein [Weissella koreensis]